MIIQGHALTELRKMELDSIDCVVTSPPYWSLRKYDIPDVDFGDWIGQLGLEPTFDLYLKHLLEIFDEVKRVLKKEGTCWVNLGDSYGTSSGAGDRSPYKEGTNRGSHYYEETGKPEVKNLQKSLILIPYRFAIEMLNSNWILREDLTKEEREYVLTQLIKRGII